MEFGVILGMLGLFEGMEELSPICALKVVLLNGVIYRDLTPDYPNCIDKTSEAHLSFLIIIEGLALKVRPITLGVYSFLVSF